jgi:predicted SAM-dependent methyltransferase
MKREKKLKLLNIGCGSVLHPAWINLDISSSSPYVKLHDIRRGLPFSNYQIDACYCSHVLEHLTPGQARRLLAECYRVLKPSGILRIAVPDLESIVRSYLGALEKAKTGARGAEPNYNWMMLELLDQTVRGVSGGEMGCYLRDPEISNKEFVAARIGIEATQCWREGPERGKRNISQEARSIAKDLSHIIRQIRLNLAKISVYCLAGAEARLSFSEGLFRRSGEIHRWAYDSYSLWRLLEQSQFVEINGCRADESRIPDFSRYELDVIDGQVRKPDSLFVEARKT